MFIAHLPAGYMLTTATQSRTGSTSRAILLTGLLASILPDFDLPYHFLLDPQTQHHQYFTHWASFWIPACGLLWFVLRTLRVREAGLLGRSSQQGSA